MFFICWLCLIFAPLARIEDEIVFQMNPGELYHRDFALENIALPFAFYGVQICWMAMVLFAPIRELTRRLTLLVLGMLTLAALNELSKLSLHQYLQAPKASFNLSFEAVG